MRSPAKGETHGGLKGSKVRVDVVAVCADDDELAGLVGRDEERYSELPHQGRETRCVNAPQRSRFS
jgi:hypothetical protein